MCFSEFILAERGEKYALREADLVHSFFVLAEDIERYALACYLCELTSALSDPGLESPGAVQASADGAARPRAEKA